MATLDKLGPGHHARILRIEEDGIALRLMEMGFLPGDVVEVIGRAPLGDPIAIYLRGSRLALRAAEARRVHVEPLGTATPAQASSVRVRP